MRIEAKCEDVLQNLELGIMEVERSVQRWNKSGGRQGYLKFVAQFFPEGEAETAYLRIRA